MTVGLPLPLGYGWIEAVMPLLVVVCFPIDRGSANFVLKHGRHVCVLTLVCPSLAGGHPEVSLAWRGGGGALVLLLKKILLA